MIRIVEGPLDPSAALGDFARGLTAESGGIASFIGLVRDASHGVPVKAITLEHYPGMAEKALAEIEALAHRRWPLSASLLIHRVGRMVPGEPIVLVAAASSHRQAAFDACQFLIDWLKTKAPFWKLEETASGAHWVEARASDDQAAARWDAAPPN